MQDELIKSDYSQVLYKFLLEHKEYSYSHQKEEIRATLSWSLARLKKAFAKLSEEKLIKYQVLNGDTPGFKGYHISVKGRED